MKDLVALLIFICLSITTIYLAVRTKIDLKMTIAFLCFSIIKGLIIKKTLPNILTRPACMSIIVLCRDYYETVNISGFTVSNYDVIKKFKWGVITDFIPYQFHQDKSIPVSSVI